jgi:hypothetical protein
MGMLAGLQQMRRSHPDFQVNLGVLELNFFLTNNKNVVEKTAKPITISTKPKKKLINLKG